MWTSRPSAVSTVVRRTAGPTAHQAFRVAQAQGEPATTSGGGGGRDGIGGGDGGSCGGVCDANAATTAAAGAMVDSSPLAGNSAAEVETAVRGQEEEEEQEEVADGTGSFFWATVAGLNNSLHAGAAEAMRFLFAEGEHAAAEGRQGGRDGGLDRQVDGKPESPVSADGQPPTVAVSVLGGENSSAGMGDGVASIPLRSAAGGSHEEATAHVAAALPDTAAPDVFVTPSPRGREVSAEEKVEEGEEEGERGEHTLSPLTEERPAEVEGLDREIPIAALGVGGDAVPESVGLGAAGSNQVAAENVVGTPPVMAAIGDPDTAPRQVFADSVEVGGMATSLPAPSTSPRCEEGRSTAPTEPESASGEASGAGGTGDKRAAVRCHVAGVQSEPAKAGFGSCGGGGGGGAPPAAAARCRGAAVAGGRANSVSPEQAAIAKREELTKRWAARKKKPPSAKNTRRKEKREREREHSHVAGTTSRAGAFSSAMARKGPVSTVDGAIEGGERRSTAAHSDSSPVGYAEASGARLAAGEGRRADEELEAVGDGAKVSAVRRDSMLTPEVSRAKNKRYCDVLRSRRAGAWVGRYVKL